MKIGIASREFTEVGSHAGQCTTWLVYDLSSRRASQVLPAPLQVRLGKDEVLHLCNDALPHPLDGLDLVVAASAGKGFVRHMKQRGTEVLLTGESDPAKVITQIVAGEALAEQGFDPSAILCKLRDLFSRF